MLRTLNIASLFTLLAFFVSPTAFAQDTDVRAEASNTEVNLAIYRPNTDAVGKEEINLSHYQVAVFELTRGKEELSTCPTNLSAPAVQPTVTSMADLPKTDIVLKPNHTYLVGSYHRVENFNGQAVWSWTTDSCRKLTPVLPGPDLSYQPLINWRPPETNFSTSIRIVTPATKPEYVTVQARGDECPRVINGSGTHVARPLGDPKDYRIELSGGGDFHGHWVLGTYLMEAVMVDIEGGSGAQVQQDRFTWVRGTCQPFVVNDYDGEVTYQPTLPKRVLAVAAPPVAAADTVLEPVSSHMSSKPEWLVGAGGGGAYEPHAGSSGNATLHASLTMDHMVYAARVGMDIVPIPPEAISLRPKLSFGTGYGHSFALPRPILALPSTFAFDVLLSGGVGSFQAECGPQEFDSSATDIMVTCGHNEGFPLRVVAPWFGPELSARLLWPTHTKAGKPYHVGLNLTAAGQAYVVSNSWPRYVQLEGRTTTVHSTEGDREVTYAFEKDTMVWFVPELGASLVFVW